MVPSVFSVKVPPLEPAMAMPTLVPSASPARAAVSVPPVTRVTVNVSMSTSISAPLPLSSKMLPLNPVSSSDARSSSLATGASLTGATEPKDRVSGAPSSVPSVGTMVRSGTGPL